VECLLVVLEVTRCKVVKFATRSFFFVPAHKKKTHWRVKSFVELFFFGLKKSMKTLPHPEMLNFVAKINKLFTFYFKHFPLLLFSFSFRSLSPLFLFPTIAQKVKHFPPSLTLTIAFKRVN
jgi:hypothetical protein